MKLSQELLHRIHRHLETGYPNEACGVMLGKAGVITEIASVDNQRTEVPATGGESARNRYLIDPLAYMKIEKDADRRNIQVLGIYHSHPDVAARPSETDRKAGFPDLSYLIVSVAKGKAVESRSWRLRDDYSQFDEEAVEILG
jgi:proteasome lid subunit RPN8/RPN11